MFRCCCLISFSKELKCCYYYHYQVLLCRDTFAKAVRTQHWCETQRYCFLVFLYRERLDQITDSVGVSLSTIALDSEPRGRRYVKNMGHNRNILHTLKKEPLNIMLLHTCRTMDGPWIKTVPIVSHIFDVSSSTGLGMVK